jgi:hypothetical protein
MITAEKLALLTNFPVFMLTKLAKEVKWAGPEFTGAKFLGITNGGQFCYTVTFPVKGGTDSTKMFLTYDPAEGRVSADIDQ